jgi:hypothetical protein
MCEALPRQPAAGVRASGRSRSAAHRAGGPRVESCRATDPGATCGAVVKPRAAPRGTEILRAEYDWSGGAAVV